MYKLGTHVLCAYYNNCQTNKVLITDSVELTPLCIIELGCPVRTECEDEEGDPEDGVDEVEDGEESDDRQGHSVMLQSGVIAAERGQHVDHLHDRESRRRLLLIRLLLLFHITLLLIINSHDEMTD